MSVNRAREAVAMTKPVELRAHFDLSMSVSA